MASGCSPWAAESPEQREWELPDPHGPELRAGSCWPCSEQDAVLSVCTSVPSLGKGCRAHRDAALSCACQGQELILLAELWHPLCCAPGWLLPFAPHLWQKVPVLCCSPRTHSGRSGSRHRHGGAGAALVLSYTVAMEMITLSRADILPPRAPVQPLCHSLWCR